LARGLIGNDPFTSLELEHVMYGSNGRSALYEVKKLLAPVPMPPAILGIGLNYWGHINASNLTAPKTPSLFFKNRRSYNHPHDPIVVPPSSSLPDYEGELAIVIGKDCKDVSEEDALDCVLGYTVCNDFSARCLQAEDPHNPRCQHTIVAAWAMVDSSPIPKVSTLTAHSALLLFRLKSLVMDRT
jgi:2-keto-4-pentenoate hydratase/2-oxohepta-3-ene-1,7-dioic acid hydratase in catechol pathway